MIDIAMASDQLHITWRGLLENHLLVQGRRNDRRGRRRNVGYAYRVLASDRSHWRLESYLPYKLLSHALEAVLNTYLTTPFVCTCLTFAHSIALNFYVQSTPIKYESLGLTGPLGVCAALLQEL